MKLEAFKTFVKTKQYRYLRPVTIFMAYLITEAGVDNIKFKDKNLKFTVEGKQKEYIITEAFNTVLCSDLKNYKRIHKELSKISRIVYKDLSVD